MRTQRNSGWPAAVILAAILTVPVLSHEAGAVQPSPQVVGVVPVVGARSGAESVAILPTTQPGWSDVPPSAEPTRHPEPVHQLVPERTPQPTSHRTGRSVTGTATWFCGGGSACTRGYGPECRCAAAGPALRVGQWRGRVVVVMAGGRSVQVTLRDWCACPGRVIDLYRGAFSQLADPSVGVLKVTVSWQ